MPNPGDGRGGLVELTAWGRELVDRVLPAHLETEERILDPLDADERAVLAALLARLDR
jgi:DNA-binding MarR family transcriptional regulator